MNFHNSISLEQMCIEVVVNCIAKQHLREEAITGLRMCVVLLT